MRFVKSPQQRLYNDILIMSTPGVADVRKLSDTSGKDWKTWSNLTYVRIKVTAQDVKLLSIGRGMLRENATTRERDYM